MSTSDMHGDGAMPPGRALRRFLLRQRTWGVLTAAAVLAIGIAMPATSFAGSSTPATASAGDPAVISDWNAIAATTLAGDTTKQPVEDILYMGFVQAAVYNAVVGVEGRYAPYRFHAHAPRGASAQAAAVAAAHKVLVTYVPSAQAALDADYAASLAQIPDGKAKTQRRRVRHPRRRQPDPAARPRRPQRPHLLHPAAGARCLAAHPAPVLPMSAPWLGFVTPLLVRSATQFAPPATAGAHLGALHPRLRRGQGARLG